MIPFIHGTRRVTFIESANALVDAGARAGEGGRADRAFVFNWDRVRAALVGQLVKNPPAVREALVPFLGWEDPLEKGKATRSRILAWRMPWLYSPPGHKELDTIE